MSDGGPKEGAEDPLRKRGIVAVVLLVVALGLNADRIRAVISGKDLGTLRAEVQRLVRVGDVEAALELAEDLWGDRPEDAETLAFLAATFHTHDRPELAREVLEAGEALEPDVAEWPLRQARLAEQLRDARRMIEALERAHKTDPNHPEVLMDLGRVRYSEGDLARATELYRTATEVAPNNTAAHTFYAACLDKNGNPAGAQEEYMKALQLEPRNVRAMTAIGVLLHKQKKFGEAKRWYERALEANPDAEPPKKFLAKLETDAAAGGL
jgi:tetratricopeptide (TPR) repeat protein